VVARPCAPIACALEAIGARYAVHGDVPDDEEAFR